MKKTFSFLFLIFTAITFSFGQAALSGKILDEKQRPLEFANVLLLNAQDSVLVKGGLTDSAGVYFFDDVAAGHYLILATMVGLSNVYSLPFEVGSAMVTLPPLQFGNDGGVALSEVVVKAQRPFIELKANKIVMNIENSPIVAGDNALEVLRKAPGVLVDKDNNVSLKGKQGVMILIDGKQTYLSQTEIVRLLEGTPAASIGEVEIIMNPSAKYDAAGNAGIINIVMKKDKNLGLNGGVNLSGGTGRFGFTNGGIRLNYRQKKLNIFGNADSWYRKGFQLNDIYREVPYNGLVTIFNQSSDQKNHSYGINYRAGVDWFVSDKTTIGVLANGSNGVWGHENESNTYLSGDNTAPFSLVRAMNDGSNEWNNISFNVNAKHDFGKGKELTFDADYSTYYNPENSHYNNYYFNNNQEVEAPYLLQSNNLSDIRIRALKADYTHVINEQSNLEAGLKSSFVTTQNSIFFEEQDANGDWQNDSSRTNSFHFQENIHAAYVNYSRNFKGVSLQIGVRTEYTDNTGRSQTLNEELRRTYLDFFPSVSLSHNLGEKHNLSYSYSRRIDRPTYEDLNPFIFFLDQYTFGKGNPFLNPQYTHSFNLSYGYNQFLFLNASYSKTSNAISDIIEQVDSVNLTYQTKTNLANLDNVSFDLSTPLPITKWWAARLNLSTFYNRYRFEYVNGTVDNQQWALNAYISNNFTINKSLTAEVSGFYQSPMVFAILHIQQQWSINAGFTKTILGGKGTLKFTANDIFRTMRFSGTIEQGSINAVVSNRWQSQRFTVAFSYRFGNSNVKPERRRSTATDEEQRRANNN